MELLIVYKSLNTLQIGRCFPYVLTRDFVGFCSYGHNFVVRKQIFQRYGPKGFCYKGNAKQKSKYDFWSHFQLLIIV